MNMGEVLQGAKNWLGFGSKPEVVPIQIPDWVEQAVVDLRQQFYEDPGFVRSFFESVQYERQRREMLDAAEARKRLDGEEWIDELPDPLCALIDRTAHSVLEPILHPTRIFEDDDDFGVDDDEGGVGGDEEQVDLPPHERAAREYYERIGRAIVEAFELGLNECPPLLRQAGVIGHYYPGIGTLVVRERLLDLQFGNDEAVDDGGNANNPEPLNE